MRFLVSMPEELHGALRAAARKRGQTLSGFIRDTLWDWLREYTEKETKKKEGEFS